MPTQHQELGNLLQTRTSLAKTLEADPVFQAIQHVDKAIAALQTRTPAHQAAEMNQAGTVIAGASTPQQRDAIANGAIESFIGMRNVSITIKDLCEVLREQGIPLPAAAVSSVGGILGKREMFMKDPAKAGHWKLTAEYYAQHRNSTSRAA